VPQRRLPEAEKVELVRAYVGGAQMKDLAATHGVHRVTVAEIVSRAGVPARRRGLDAEQVEEAARLYACGWSLTRLGGRFGVDGTTMWRALRARGVAMRDTQGQER
jgi:transposase-like protein